jgi:hypothetical protein
MQTMVADDQTMRLVELHKYERARRAPLSDEVYRANANLVLHDENCHRWVLWDLSKASTLLLLSRQAPQYVDQHIWHRKSTVVVSHACEKLIQVGQFVDT